MHAKLYPHLYNGTSAPVESENASETARKFPAKKVQRGPQYYEGKNAWKKVYTDERLEAASMYPFGFAINTAQCLCA
jgi:hypothetical protein